MRFFASVLVLLALVLAISVPAAHALTEADVEPTTGPNEDYARAIRGGRVQSEIVYLRPSADFQPGGDIEIDVPEPPTQPSEGWTTERWFWIILFSAILIGLLLVIFKNANAVSVSFRPTNEKRRSKDTETDPSFAQTEHSATPFDSFLEQLKAMSDRREALILLVSRTLELAAERNDIRLGRSQTARDVVRVLPRSWPQLSAIRRLVREAEIAHFGGRDVAEDVWQECLASAKPIFAEGGAA